MPSDPSAGRSGRISLFEPDGLRLVPTEYARGPWSKDALHGGPVAALAVRAAERLGSNQLRLVRITVELLRPVPVAPLDIRSKVVRSGRKVQLVDTVLGSDGTEVAWSRALFIRSGLDQLVPDSASSEDVVPSPAGSGRPMGGLESPYRAFHNEAVEMRFVSGNFDAKGPATVWMRLRGSVVAGEQPSPWQRVAAVADFGNGVSAELDFGSSVFINPDLTVSVHRPPVGEWVCLEARTRFGSPGIGAAESALWDERGRIGRAVQSLLVETG